MNSSGAKVGDRQSHRIGNPLLFDAPDRKAGDLETIDLIMKDGVIYKNTL